MAYYIGFTGHQEVHSGWLSKYHRTALRRDPHAIMVLCEVLKEVKAEITGYSFDDMLIIVKCKDQKEETRILTSLAKKSNEKKPLVFNEVQLVELGVQNITLKLRVTFKPNDDSSFLSPPKIFLDRLKNLDFLKKNIDNYWISDETIITLMLPNDRLITLLMMAVNTDGLIVEKESTSICGTLIYNV